MWSIDSTYALMFISGLLGGFGHCIGMCGPVVAANALNAAPGKGILLHLQYNLGRLTTYSLIGGLMGLTGSFAGVIKPVESSQNLMMGAIGVVMILMGLIVGGWLPNMTRQSGCGWNRFSGLVRFISEAGGQGAFFPLGLVMGFIPCGLSYTAFIAAAGAGVTAGGSIQGFLKGMFMLFLFGLGTAPALLLLGSVVSVLGQQTRLRLYRASSIAMIIAGSLFVYRALVR